MHFPSFLKQALIPAISRRKYSVPHLDSAVPFLRYMSKPAISELFPENEDWVIGNETDTYHEAMIGDVLGAHYTVQRKIGQGVYSTVWMVNDTRK